MSNREIKTEIKRVVSRVDCACAEVGCQGKMLYVPQTEDTHQCDTCGAREQIRTLYPRTIVEDQEI